MPLILFSQKEAVNWYFGEQAGADFNSGNPVLLYNGVSSSGFGGTSCISDSSGQLLFYTNGETIWNRQQIIMVNGSGLAGYKEASQAALIVPSPGSTSEYFIFTVGNDIHPKGLYYSIVDMNLDGGLGAVITKNIAVPAASDANIFLTATKHSNNRDWWIIVRRLNNDKYAAFHLTSAGLNMTPVLSTAKFMALSNNNGGQMKVSPDRALLIASLFKITATGADIEINKFNSSTGTIEYLFSIGKIGKPNYGIEFSPDSKYLYASYFIELDTSTIIQYDLSSITPSSLEQSSVIIGHTYSANNSIGELQLASDGRIYTNANVCSPSFYLSVINDPWKKGTDCNFQSDSFWLGGHSFYEALPNFPQEFLYRFVWNGGTCAGVPFNFKHRFLPEPDSIHWDFGDPGSGASNYSTVHNPSHTFSAGGTYEVYSYVHYPNGRVEETSRKVDVLAKPYPNLGPDTLVCNGANVSITPGSGFAGYYWNGSIMPGNPSYLATDTGTYIVRVKNDLGCYNSDTIKVAQRPAPLLDETTLNIAPTTCGGTTGAITGLQVIGKPPFAYHWSASGTPFSDSIDIFHLGTGLYQLSVTDGYGCSNPVASYAISDAGNILIDTASVTPSYCGNNDGTLLIKAVSGLGNMLQYFIKSGSDTLSKWSDGHFNGLPGGTYYVWVSDSSGCSSVYPTPLIITDLTAPIITSVASTPETGTDSDGTISIIASGAGLNYSLNGAPAVNTGTFTGLQTGSYTIKVTNPAGCDTTFTVFVGHQTGILLSAIAGNGSACLGKTAKAPLIVSNFTNVQAFDASLNYEKLYVTCIGYIPNPLPQLADSLEVMLFPLTGIIRARWKGGSSLTLPDSSELLKLVFTSILPGNALLLWDVSPSVSHFTDPAGDTLNVNYTMGQIQVNNPPEILPDPVTKACEGNLLMVWPIIQNGTGPISYQWETPLGSVTGKDNITKIAALDDNGQYQLIATDTLNCADTATMNVTVTPLPVSGFTTDTLYFDEHYNLPVTQGYDSYAWNTGDSTYSILVTSEGWYKVTMKTPEGCTSTDSIMMLYSFAPFNMPNAFTPNGDGKNDQFRPVTLPEKVKSFTMYIYNRWGQLIFSTNDLSKGWDGTFNGSPAPLGVYTYIVSYGNQTGESRKKTGTFTLVR